MYAARWGNSRIVLLFEVLSATPPPPTPSTPHCLGRKRSDVANFSPQSVYILPPVSSFFMQLVWTSSGVRQCSALFLPLPSLTHTSVLTCTFSGPFLVFFVIFVGSFSPCVVPRCLCCPRVLGRKFLFGERADGNSDFPLSLLSFPLVLPSSSFLWQGTLRQPRRTHAPHIDLTEQTGTPHTTAQDARDGVSGRAEGGGGGWGGVPHVAGTEGGFALPLTPRCGKCIHNPARPLLAYCCRNHHAQVGQRRTSNMFAPRACPAEGAANNRDPADARVGGIPHTADPHS